MLFRSGNDKVHRLFASPRAEEAAYYKRTGVYPIMHVLCVREKALAQHPGLAAHLFELFSQSKALGRKWARGTPSLNLAWKDDYLEEERRIFGGDPCVFGLDANRSTLEKFLGFCYDQGISAKRIAPQDLFARETWALREETK